MTEKRIIDDAFMELTDIHSKSTALQALANYLQCSRVSAQDLDYDSVLSVFETALNYIVSVNLSVSYVQNQLLYNSNDQRRYI